MNARRFTASTRYLLAPAAPVQRSRIASLPLSLAVLLAMGLSACGDGSASSALSTTESASTDNTVVSEASAPLAMPASPDVAATQTNPGAPALAESSSATDAQRAKNTPPPRPERQMGQIAAVSPGGFQLGSTKVVIDGSTTIDPPNALTEGEPVDVTGFYEADRKTLRATLVRSTRPAAEPDSVTADASAASSS